MTTLHQIHRPDRLQKDIVQWWQAGDTLLLIEGAVVALACLSQWSRDLPEGIQITALKDDVIGRGLPLNALPDDVTLISDHDWVALTIQHDRVISWS